MPPPAEDGVREALGRSCAGRELLESFERPLGAGARTGTALLVEGLEAEVRRLTGVRVDGSDPRLVEACRALERLPRAYCAPEPAVMVLIDEWSARIPGGSVARPTQERLVDALRDRRPPRGEPTDRFLAERFPVLYEPASEMVGFLSGRGEGTTTGTGSTVPRTRRR